MDSWFHRDGERFPPTVRAQRMFNVRLPFPWLYMSPQAAKQQRPGFDIEAPLLAGFIEAAAQANSQPRLDREVIPWWKPTDLVQPPAGGLGQALELRVPAEVPGFNVVAPPRAPIGLEGFRPELPPGQWPEPTDDAPEPEAPLDPQAQEYEIRVPPGIGGTIVDDPAPPSPSPEPDPPVPQPEDDAPYPQPDGEPWPEAPEPYPAPGPAPTPPSRDPVGTVVCSPETRPA